MKSGTPEGNLTRLRRGALWLLFATVLLIPNAIAARRRIHAWNVMRFAAGSLGIAAIAAGFTVTLGNPARIVIIAVGAVFTALALLIPPDRSAGSPNSSMLIDLRARELGALVVVDGGRYANSNRRVEARLFVGPQQLSVMDTSLNTLVKIPMAQITALRVERETEAPQESNAAWILRVAWERSTAEFIYLGPFAEHLARVAESTISSQLRRELPVLR